MLRKERPIILASGSPRRKELLAGLGLKFTVLASDVNEEIADISTPAKIVEQLAERKATAVAQQLEAGIVIGSDTIVVLLDEILGKPQDEEDAFAMLKRLQGNKHTVYSGLAILDVQENKKKIGHQSTQVTMRSLTDQEIHQYIATGEPMDKAGFYAIQGIGAIFVEEIVGDYYNVVGLPLRLTAQYLREFGIDVLPC